jgi:hypothetical protein
MTSAVTEQLAALAAMDRHALVAQWQTIFGTPVPKSLQAGLLSRLLAWRLQHNALDQVAPGRSDANSLTRRLKGIARSPGTLSLAPGSRLVREWQGTTHHVLTVDGGFEYQGHRYRSLSAIAKVITGTPWSGPAFFGLRS